MYATMSESNVVAYINNSFTFPVSLHSYGATIVISLADITTETGVTELLSDANHLGQVDAIFNLAMVSVSLKLQLTSHWKSCLDANITDQLLYIFYL